MNLIETFNSLSLYDLQEYVDTQQEENVSSSPSIEAKLAPGGVIDRTLSYTPAYRNLKATA